MLNFRMNMPVFLMVFYGSIMIVLVLLFRKLLRNKLPKFVFPMLWSLVMLRLLVPFSISSPFSLPVPLELMENLEAFLREDSLLQEAVLHDDVMIMEEIYEGSSGRAVEQIYEDEGSVYHVTAQEEYGRGSWFSASRMIFSLYLLGLAGTVGILAWQKYCYSRKLREGLLLEHNETVNEMLRSMDMGEILVFTSDEVASPMVCGLLNPRIYLPTRMDFQNTSLLRHILAHETMHIRRRDNWRKAVMLFVLCLNWYNPLVWLMAKCLSSDLEAACDEAVLKTCDAEEQKAYAFSLLAMAITGNRTTLLYSAFSKTEVERRIKSIVHYRKASAALLLGAVLFVLCSAAAFASGAQAPFSDHLTSFLASGSSRWGVRAGITRDIALGQEYERRAERVVFDVLREDETEDPRVIEKAILDGLAKEFGVERSAFWLKIDLCLDEEEVRKQYEPFGLVKGEDGCYRCLGEQVRIYEDKMLGSYQSREDGVVDVSVERNELGEITGITVWREGDPTYDQRTRDRQQYRSYGGISYGTAEAAEVR